MVYGDGFMRQEWYIQNRGADFKALSEKFNISPITARLIRNRGIIEESDYKKFIYGDINDMYSPFLMKDVEKAVKILLSKRDEEKRVRIIGDYDIDGVCSSHILKSMLTAVGINADVDIPHRIIDGYGISKRLVDKAVDDGVDTIITCDNGISAREALSYAKEKGFTVILTDHHEVPYEEIDGEICQIIPKADAVINPKQKDCTYPYKELCGAMVAFKLGLALLISVNYSELDSLVEELIVFGAIATVGDIMPLTDENRIIVKEGLKRIASVNNIGLRALISVNQLDLNSINTYHFGFVIGPCINAAGRLESAMEAYLLFEETEVNSAVSKAMHLKELNAERKNMTKAGLDKAVEMVEAEGVLPIIFVYVEGIHESVSGIVAGKLKEMYNRPAFVITDSNGILKGAARSIESYSMFEKLQECKDLFIKFGGHKMAAGFSLEKENFDKIKSFLINHCGLTDKDFTEKVSIDFQLPVEYVSKELVEELKVLEPFGNGNPEPLFAERDLNVYSLRRAGEKNNVILLDILMKNMQHIRGVYFKDADALYDRLKEDRKLTCVYAPKLNEYKGNVSVQMVVEYFR